MKFFIKKSIKNKKGFALLFSVLVSSLLLTIGLSIFNIALKELAISWATQRSIHAFYAADSGYECAKYWDSRTELIPTVVLSNLSERLITPIQCGGSDSVLDSREKSPESQEENDAVTSTYTFSGDLNAVVKIEKEKNDPLDLKCSDGQAICTTISSRGWDSDSGDKVERAIEIKY